VAWTDEKNTPARQERVKLNIRFTGGFAIGEAEPAFSIKLGKVEISRQQRAGTQNSEQREDYDQFPRDIPSHASPQKHGYTKISSKLREVKDFPARR
jgi:hypothetical protein